MEGTMGVSRSLTRSLFSELGILPLREGWFRTLFEQRTQKTQITKMVGRSS